MSIGNLYIGYDGIVMGIREELFVGGLIGTLGLSD